MDEDEDRETQNDTYETKDFNLADQGEALIGFKGKFGRFIESLAFYKAQRIDYQVIKPTGKRKAKKQPMVMMEDSNFSEYEEI